jgi:hypothetical protein
MVLRKAGHPLFASFNANQCLRRVLATTMARIPSLDDAEHWLRRADESRDLAEQMGDPISREMMLLIARDCEGLAENARDRAAQQQKAV